jgi:Peptidase family M28/PA domain
MIVRPVLLSILAAGWISAAASAPATSDCRTRVNDTRAKLLECIQAGALWHHLAHFQKIADANPHDGHASRDTGTPGYLASVDYVAHLMRNAGYRVTIQPYEWRRFEILGTPAFAVDGETSITDWSVARLSGSGTVAAPMQPADSGCSAKAFAGFARGRIALLRRGSCAFDTAVANARDAGAGAVVLYNDDGNGEAGRGARDGRAFPATLETPADIAVVGVLSYAQGAALAARASAGALARIDIRTQHKSDTDYNLIADSPFGDPRRTVVVDAHLDSIHGAGMLDNASGSTTILEIALNMARTHTRNRLRYIWFGGEELGLLGSHHYVNTLSAEELGRIAFDIDVDVTATPNFDVLIADPANARNVEKFPPNVVPRSKIGNRAFADYFRSAGIVSRSAGFGNDGTDSNAFSLVGVPNTGILTQQDCCKKEWEVALWGGFLGNYEGKVPGHDGGCVDRANRWCDNLSNNDRFVFEFVSKATAAVAFTLANDRSLRR